MLNAAEISRELIRIGERLTETNSTLKIDEALKSFSDVVRSSKCEALLEGEILRQVESVQGLTVPVEIIQYVAHVFAWPSLRRAVATLLIEARSSDLRGARALELIDESLSEDWEDRDLFPSLCG
ncbi:hypothetical protein ACN28G_04295 [Micromonospora sp. WMMA1923]|uniref:hypothetical protein n=1 Tax=Micromonospora sp. WMMA1923 TaxID=3404125 RepID=UPI003B953058